MHGRSAESNGEEVWRPVPLPGPCLVVVSFLRFLWNRKSFTYGRQLRITFTRVFVVTRIKSDAVWTWNQCPANTLRWS